MLDRLSAKSDFRLFLMIVDPMNLPESPGANLLKFGVVVVLLVGNLIWI